LLAIDRHQLDETQLSNVTAMLPLALTLTNWQSDTRWH